MSESLYLIFGVLWIVASILLGLYITGRGMSEKAHYGIGLKTIIISYVVGIVMLFTLIVAGG